MLKVVSDTSCEMTEKRKRHQQQISSHFPVHYFSR